MIPLGMMGQVLADHMVERPFAQHHHLLQGLLLDGAHEPFAMGIEIRTPWGQDDYSRFAQIWVVSLGYLDRSVQAEDIGVPIDRVDQHTVPERETTATRRSSTPGRSSQLPGPVCVAASVVAIRSRGWVRPLAMPASSGHGAKPHACMPATTTAVVPTLGALGCTPWSGASVDAGVGAAPDALVRQRW
jgi:hypothetical protein